MQVTNVKNVVNARGNTVPNQFLLYTPEGVYFQSYSTIIAFRSKNGTVTLDQDSWDFSRTTGKYRNLFLRETKADTLKKIESGTYVLADLNK